jgi:hypothetical protein
MRGRATGRVARALALAALLSVPALSGCSGRCDERFVLDSASPNGYTIATVYVRDCGLGAESQTHVNLRPRQEKFKPNNGGVIEDGEVFTVAGHQTVYAVWKDERNLQIECGGGGTNHVFKHESSWKAVTISFVTK